MAAEKASAQGTSAARLKSKSAREQGTMQSSASVPQVSAPQASSTVSVQAPARLLNCTPVQTPLAPPLVPTSCPAPAPKPKPKPKKAPVLASQPKLLQFFEAQASKATATPSSLPSSRPSPPKLPSAQYPLPKPQTPREQGSNSHGGGRKQVGPPEKKGER